MKQYLLKKIVFLTFFVAFSVSVFTGCGMLEVQSTWRNREVTIDGIDDGDEWANARYFLEKKDITIGLLNDESNLYIRLSSHDNNMQRQLMAFGFTVWFDAEGGKKKTLGIHFPIGMQGSSMQMMNRDRNTSRDKDSEQPQKMIEDLHKEIEIIGPGKNESNKMLFSDVIELGINVKINVTRRNLVYELQIPLTRNELQPYGIGTDITPAIGIGLETGNIDMSQMRDQRGGRLGGGDIPGGGRIPDGGGMGGGRRGSGMRPQMPESLELWLKTTLAQEPIAL